MSQLFLLNMVLPYKGFSGGPDSKESTYKAGDVSSITESVKSPGKGHGNHSRVLAWRFPWRDSQDIMEREAEMITSGRLPAFPNTVRMGSQTQEGSR